MSDEPERIEQGSHPEREEGNGARTAATALVAFGTLALLFAAAVVVFLLIAELTRGQWMLAGSAVVVLAFLLSAGQPPRPRRPQPEQNPWAKRLPRAGVGLDEAALRLQPAFGGADSAASTVSRTHMRQNRGFGSFRALRRTASKQTPSSRFAETGTWSSWAPRDCQTPGFAARWTRSSRCRVFSHALQRRRSNAAGGGTGDASLPAVHDVYLRLPPLLRCWARLAR